MMIQKLTELIGNTPLVKLDSLLDADDVELFAKLEGVNPGGSVKDRMAAALVEDGERRDDLGPGGEIVEPTSGNTGIGLALMEGVKGYAVTLVMPEGYSEKRTIFIEALDARVEQTPRTDGMAGAIQRAEEIVAFVCGVGTAGTIVGCALALREKYPGIKVYAVEPAASPVLSGGERGVHGIQGIGAGFVPPFYEPDLVDGVLTVSDDEDFNACRELVERTGILVGPSSGAAVAACRQLLAKDRSCKRIVTVLPDRGERYISTGLFA